MRKHCPSQQKNINKKQNELNSKCQAASHELAVHIQQMQEMGQMDLIQITVDVGILLIDLVKLSVGVVSGEKIEKQIAKKEILK